MSTTSRRREESKVNLERKSNFKAIGRNALAKGAYRYGFRNVESGFIFAPEGRNGKVLAMKNAGIKEDATEIATRDIALDCEHTIPVMVGTPGVKLHLDVDTGSADMICWSTEARAEVTSRKDHALYDPKRSKTAKLEKGLKWQMVYGDGSQATGDVHSDRVCIGNVEAEAMCVQVAQKLSNSFIQDVGSDGMLGCAWPKMNTVQPKGVNTWMAHAMEHLEKPLFTANIMHGKGGFYTFGHIDESVTSNELHYTAVNNREGMWKVKSAHWKLDNEQKPASFKDCVLDTGMCLILLDDACVNEFYQRVEGAQLNASMGGWTFPENAKLPSLAICIGNCPITMAPETLRFGEPNGEGHVFGTVQSCGDLGHAVLGDAFFKNAYVVFNQGTAEVGVAQKSV